MKNLIPGGLAAKKKLSSFNPKKLKAGINVEMEHTTSRAIAREISADHLAEDPDYYEKLKLVEKAEALDIFKDAYSTPGLKLGKTRSGKTITSNVHPLSGQYPSRGRRKFTAADHRDAAKLHAKAAKNFTAGSWHHAQHTTFAQFHNDHAATMTGRYTTHSPAMARKVTATVPYRRSLTPEMRKSVVPVIVPLPQTFYPTPRFVFKPKMGEQLLAGEVHDRDISQQLDTAHMPPGRFMDVRKDLTRFAPMPVTRAAMKYGDHSYSGIIDSDGLPYFFAFNSRGLLLKAAPNEEATWRAFDDFMDAEHRQALLDRRSSAGREQTVLVVALTEKSLVPLVLDLAKAERKKAYGHTAYSYRNAKGTWVHVREKGWRNPDGHEEDKHGYGHGPVAPLALTEDDGAAFRKYVSYEFDSFFSTLKIPAGVSRYDLFKTDHSNLMFNKKVSPALARQIINGGREFINKQIDLDSQLTDHKLHTPADIQSMKYARDLLEKLADRASAGGDSLGKKPQTKEEAEHPLKYEYEHVTWKMGKNPFDKKASPLAWKCFRALRDNKGAGQLHGAATGYGKIRLEDALHVVRNVFEENFNIPNPQTLERQTEKVFDYLVASGVFEPVYKPRKHVAYDEGEMIEAFLADAPVKKTRKKKERFRSAYGSMLSSMTEVEVTTYPVSPANQQTIRDQFRAIISKHGIDSREGDKPAAREYTVRDIRKAAGLHHWDGKVELATYQHAAMHSYFEALSQAETPEARAAVKLNHRASSALSTMIHETLHGAAPPVLSGGSYNLQTGKQIEEVTTESLARVILHDEYGSKLPEEPVVGRRFVPKTSEMSEASHTFVDHEGVRGYWLRELTGAGEPYDPYKTMVDGDDSYGSNIQHTVRVIAKAMDVSERHAAELLVHGSRAVKNDTTFDPNVDGAPPGVGWDAAQEFRVAFATKVFVNAMFDEMRLAPQKYPHVTSSIGNRDPLAFRSLWHGPRIKTYR